MNERIRVEKILKRYNREAPVLDGVTFTAREGECLAVFGASGSGKSVLLRLLANKEKPDSGTICTLSTAISFQTPVLDDALTPIETLRMDAALHGIPRPKRTAAVREVLTLTRLDAVRHRRVGALPFGAHKLLELARIFLSPADVLLLDEPMLGLDSDSRRDIWQHLLRMRSRVKKTIVLATSRHEDAEPCDRIILMHDGRVRAVGSLDQLRSKAGPEALVVKPAKPSATHGRRGWAGIVERQEEDSLVVEVGPGSKPAELLREIASDVAAVRIYPRRLDSILRDILDAEDRGR